MNKDQITDKIVFDAFWDEVVLSTFPQAQIKTKNQSWLMRLIGVFSNEFYEDVTTVLGTTIYFPANSELHPLVALRIAMHEYVHMVDRKNEKKYMFELKYLFPQILAALSILGIFAFWNIWFLTFLFFLLFLVPGIPANYRTRMEANAYTLSLYVQFSGLPWSILVESVAQDYAQLMNSQIYWFACRDRQLFVAMLKDRYEDLPKTHPAFVKVKTWLQI